VSSDALLPDRATNAWVMGASADDVSTLSTVGRVVWTLSSDPNALPPGRFLITEATMQEMTVAGVSANNRIGGAPGRKTG
jgi:hypothetical protein